MPVKHAKVINIARNPDLTQAELNVLISNGQFAAGTTLADIALNSDFNDDAAHTVHDLTTSEFVSANVSQWTNDAGYISSTAGDWGGTFDGLEGTAYLARANHTGTQTASTISDFNEAAQDAVGGILADTATIDFTYDDAGNSITADVKTNSIGNAQLRQSAALSVVANATNGTANVADLSASADGQVLKRSGTTLVFAGLTTSNYGAASVTYAKIQNVAATSLLGNPTGSPAAPSEITLGTGLSFSGTTLATNASAIDHNSLANLATGDVHTQYVLLAGRSGGQVLAGGTGTTDDLTLKPTSGVGTTGADIIFQYGNNGASEGARQLGSNGSWGIGQAAPDSQLHVTRTSSGGGADTLAIQNSATANNTAARINANLSTTASSYTATWEWIRSNTGGGQATYARISNHNGTASAERHRWTEQGNYLIGVTAAGTNAAKVLGIGVGTAPTTSPAAMVQLYAENVAASAELKVRDEAGNVTTLSPHNFELLDPSEPMAWAYHSYRDGSVINVDMLRAMRVLEKLSGEQLVHMGERRWSLN